MREFLKSPKKTAILGLIGSILMLSSYLVDFSLASLLDKLYVLGLIAYFIIIVLRMYKKNINIKIANWILIILYILQLLLIIPFLSYITLYNIFKLLVYLVTLVISILYFVNILFRKKNFINNKIYGITIIFATIIQIVPILRNYNGFMIKYPPMIENSIYVLNYIGYLFIIPYFYNYYNILIGGNENGK